jgi:hypothetical protein
MLMLYYIRMHLQQDEDVVRLLQDLPPALVADLRRCVHQAHAHCAQHRRCQHVLSVVITPLLLR